MDARSEPCANDTDPNRLALDRPSHDGVRNDVFRQTHAPFLLSFNIAASDPPTDERIQLAQPPRNYTTRADVV